MSSLRSELHVAQQIRRDKLRIQNTSQHLQDFPNQPPSLHHQEFPNNSDLLRVRNGNMLDVDDETAAAAIYSSEMMTSFATPSNPLPAPRNDHYCQELSSSSNSSSRQFGSFSHSSSTTNVLSSSKDDQCSFSLGNWRNSSPHQFSDWMLNNYSTSSVPNLNSFLVSELNNNNNNNNNNINYLKPSCDLLTDLQSPPSSSPQAQLYHNALQDIFKSTTSTTSAHDTEMSWGGNSASTSSVPIFHGNEQLSFETSANVWTNTNMGSISSDSNPPHQIQGLSLSLSSNSASHFEEGSTSQYSKPVNDVKPIQQDSIMGKGIARSYRNVGPLGPFTGYATILKSSRFLRPCQQLLDEWCCCQSGKQIADEWVSRDVSDDAAKGNNSGASSSMFYSSKEKSTDDGSSSFCLSSRPECQKNKVKLLCMQEEVMRRYKQYHQQMQLVVSSFESVAGLSRATPYISLALKSVSRHFKGLKNAISDQLRLTREVLGEDISIPTTCTSSKIDNNNIAKLRCMDHSFQNNKSGGSNIDFVEPQQHVWRPQRGLPERSVAILKAWLFEHFLHPYPTDTDKHMLATQTGLSRNQVSNWFINARVRVWKPMVEEIHMLETKTTTEAQQRNIINARGSASASEATHTIAERQFQCLKMGSSSSAASGNEEKGTYEQQWNQEKRSKLECEVGPNMHGTVMGFMPYRRGVVEVGGLGSVSLTLGLRHGVEGVQNQQQLQQEVELRRQFGGHMIHDFVG